jgi:3-methyladenine DNA glycosylase AlkD
MPGLRTPHLSIAQSSAPPSPTAPSVDAGSVDAGLIAAVDAGLHAAADPAIAPRMQTYMKSTTPYLGVRTPVVRALVRALERDHPATDAGRRLATVRTLWDSATYREQRYAAIELLDTRSARTLFATGVMHEAGALAVVEHLIRTGGWWDYVDGVSHRVGDLLRSHPKELTEIVKAWANDPDLWIRRSSIICQLGFKQQTNLDLLGYAVEVNLADPEFFLRKAIGWALREYARTDPDWVRSFAGTHALSPLSRREALKHLNR